MFDLIEKIGQSEINQDVFSGDYSVDYENKWGKKINVGIFKTPQEAKVAAERYSRGFDSHSDQIVDEFID